MKRTFLILIIILAAFLRLYKLDSYPALNADEAAIGYNAYSLLQTGKDEHGNPWPIHFQSFNDFKPGFYFYLVLPFVKVFGLNVWSVRLPNAILGIASVWLIYGFVGLMNDGKWVIDKNKNLLIINHYSLSIIASFLLAISPWHIHFSRGGWEVNTATFFILLGVLLFLNAVRNKNTICYVFCTLSFALSLYTYHSARIISPLLVFGLIVIYWKSIKGNLKPVLISAIIGILILLPLIKDFTRSEIISRAAGVGIIADVGPIERTNEERSEHKNYLSTSVVLLHNKFINYSLTFIKNWFEHYHGSFLFISGDEIQRNRVPETGQLYLFEILTALIGLYFIFKNYSLSTLRQSSGQASNQSLTTNHFLLILWWLLIAPIPAALTFQSPHALRAQNMVIPLTIISAYGLSEILYLIKMYVINKRLLVTCYLLLITVVLWPFSRYLHMCYLHMSKEYPFSSQYGVKELVDYIGSNNKIFKNIVVTNKYDQPYILFLFYTKYPPDEFQNDHVLTERDKYGFSTVDKYSNFVFKSIDWDRDKLLYPDSLMIGANEEIPDEANVTQRIYGSNGYMYFKVVEN